MKSGTLYSPHPGLSMIGSSTRNIKERTGKSLEEWIEVVHRDGPEGRDDQYEWLKAEHGITTNYAKWIVDEADGDSLCDYDPDALVDAQYAGKKEALRPIYNELLKLGLALGSDVKACPCGTIVPFYRKHVFAQIRPTTNTRVDLGFCLRGVAPEGRLVATGGEAKGDRITHRIGIASVGDIDDEVKVWLRRAYEADGR